MYCFNIFLQAKSRGELRELFAHLPFPEPFPSFPNKGNRERGEALISARLSADERQQGLCSHCKVLQWPCIAAGDVQTPDPLTLGVEAAAKHRDLQALSCFQLKD